MVVPRLVQLTLLFAFSLLSLLYNVGCDGAEITLLNKELQTIIQERDLSQVNSNIRLDDEYDFEVIASELHPPYDEERHLEHKPLFPLSSTDLIGLVLVVIGLIIAASGGIGGGGVLVPLLILVFGFSPKQAIPLSTFTILGSSITNMYLNLEKRHPDANRPLIDWDLMMIMEPLTIGGALAGAFLSKVLPDWILTISLVLLLAVTSHRTLQKGIQQYKKEKKEFEEQQKSALTKATEDLSAEGEQESLLPKSEISQQETNRDQLQQELDDILEAEKHTPMSRIILLSVMTLVIVILNLAKGGGPSFPSILGIDCGSFTYWFVTSLTLLWVIVIAYYVRIDLVEKWKQKKRVHYKYVPGDVEWNEKNTIIYPCLCIIAGICAGMFGVGGGVVKGPLMLEMGVHPMVAAATVAVMIFFTSIAATTSFIAMGTLTFDYAFFLFGFGLVSTAVGQILVGQLIKKYKRMSLISLSIGSVVALSTVLMGLQSVLDLLNPQSSNQSSALCT